MNDRILFNIKDLEYDNGSRKINQLWAGEIRDDILTAMIFFAGKNIDAISIEITNIPNIDESSSTSSWWKFYKNTSMSPSDYKKYGLEGQYYNIIREIYYFAYKQKIRNAEVEYNFNLLQHWTFADPDKEIKHGFRRLELFSF
jgi:hypothetical protein